MTVTILSPESIRELQAESVEFMTQQGGYVIMEGHAPLLAQLEPHKVLTIHMTGGPTKTFTLTGGIVHVTRTTVTILLA